MTTERGEHYVVQDRPTASPSAERRAWSAAKGALIDFMRCGETTSATTIRRLCESAISDLYEARRHSPEQHFMPLTAIIDGIEHSEGFFCPTDDEISQAIAVLEPIVAELEATMRAAERHR